MQELKFNKEKWRKVSLGDIVFEPKETAKDIADEGFEHIVGLEHIDSDDIHLRKSFSAETETTFTKVFKAGDVLFGRRRAYLKKAAQATFDGVCSGDITVLRAKENIDPRLLPFIIHNDKFFDYAVKHSAGGLSPRVKFKDLANYEFLLPPKEQQAELADLLWAMDEVIEKDLVVLTRLEKLLENFVIDRIFGNHLKGETISSILNQIEKSHGLELLKNVGSFFKGKGISKDVVVDEGMPCIRYGQIYTTHHNIIRNFKSFILDSEKTNSFKLKKGDIIFAGSGETITEIGKSVGFIDEFEAYVGGDTIVLRPFSNYNSIFLSYLLNSALVRLQLNKIGTGATVAHIYSEDLKKIKLPKIDLKEQDLMAISLENIYSNKARLVIKIQSSKVLLKQLINQIF